MDISDTSDNPLKIFYVSSQSDKLRRKHAIWGKYRRNNHDFTSVSKYFTSLWKCFTFALKVINWEENTQSGENIQVSLALLHRLSNCFTSFSKFFTFPLKVINWEENTQYARNIREIILILRRSQNILRPSQNFLRLLSKWWIEKKTRNLGKYPSCPLCFTSPLKFFTSALKYFTFFLSIYQFERFTRKKELPSFSPKSFLYFVTFPSNAVTFLD